MNNAKKLLQNEMLTPPFSAASRFSDDAEIVSSCFARPVLVRVERAELAERVRHQVIHFMQKGGSKWIEQIERIV